ncbi:FAD-dependent oxidoreductase [Ruegeria sp. HKCCD8929]|uniref:FAD-dependent oxidoreductase n=1 Tax=Ruegeria sp. HKCCD8929 TaxID=2683006 RepID=UPI001489F786|nr:FAD-dependent oxidoreductase [Ruegeria sp. HKCCD8929]
MDSILEPARQIPVVHRTDILVVGSGPAGLAAALAAARAGAEVTLMDRFGCFGGNITAVGVEGFAWYRHEKTVEAGGIGVYPEFVDGYGILILPTTGRYTQVPYRSMLPKGIEGLLVADRSHGADRIAHAATRNMACCAVMGQGAGIAAGQALNSNRLLDQVDIGTIQTELDRQGVRVN